MGDLHVQEDAQPSYRDLFGEVSREADVLLLTGDLTNL
ncbi:metallophosphoesterase, partial [Mesorhizobium sp. M00.F.Ca.ET.149.01.1.1]